MNDKTALAEARLSFKLWNLHTEYCLLPRAVGELYDKPSKNQ